RLAQSAQAKASCGSLRVVTRTRDDPRPNVRVSATYLEFENPLTRGERLYNELIVKQLGHLSFSGKIDDPGFKHEHILQIQSFGAAVVGAVWDLGLLRRAWFCRLGRCEHRYGAECGVGAGRHVPGWSSGKLLLATIQCP